MDLTNKSRTELKTYFVRNAIPTASNFSDLIDAMISQKDDGITKSVGSPLSIEASSTGDRPAINIYDNFATAQAPNWVLSLLPGTTTAGKTTGKGLGIGDGMGAGRARLFLEDLTGNLSIGVVDPSGYKLNVAGTVNATGAITANGGLTVATGQTLTAGGPLIANGGATVTGGVLTANAGLVVAAGQPLTAGGPLVANSGANVNGALNANGGLTVATGQPLIAGGPLTASAGATVNGALNANGAVTIAVGQTLSAGGPLIATAGATISGGVLTANSGLTVTAGQPLIAGGPLTATSGATISGGVLTANGGLTVAAGQILIANGGVTVAAGQTLTAGGPLFAYSGATISGGVLNANGGLIVPVGQTLTANGGLIATAGATVSGGVLNANLGASVSGGQLQATGGATISGGVLNANGGLAVTNGPLNSAGMLNANGGLTVPVNQILQVNGALNANGGAIVGGQLQANGGATILGGVLNANSGLSVSNGPLNSAGMLNANGGLTVPINQILQVNGTLNATAGANVSGSTLNANGGLTVPINQTLQVNGTLNATAGATVSGGVLNANGGLTVATGQTLNANGPLNANGGLTVGTSAVNQITTMNGQLLVTGAVATGDLTIGNATTNRNLVVNGSASVTQLAVGTNGTSFSGENLFNAVNYFYDNTLFFRGRSDHNHGLGFYGGAKPFQGINVNGPVLFGFSGGGLGSNAYPGGWSQIDGSVVLDGASSYVQLPTLNYDFSKGLTVEGWVYYNSFNSYSRILELGNGPNTENLIFANNGAVGDLYVTVNSAGVDKPVTARGVLQLGTWMHICATMDPLGNVVLYVNGSTVATGVSQLPKNVARNTNYIGRSSWPTDGYFSGKLGNVRIWLRPLSGQEVQDVCTGTRTVVSALSPAPWVGASLGGCWPLNDATGTNARDLSGKGAAGTLHGAAVFESYQRLALTWDNQGNVNVPVAGTLTARQHPAVQTFQVGGDWNHWYPVAFCDDGWSDGPLQLEIVRANTHQDSSWRGTTMFVMRAHCSNYGHGSQFWKVLDHYFSANQFVGGVGLTALGITVIVYLRGGGTTYQWRSNHPAHITDFSAVDSKMVGTETFTSKTAVDTNISAIGV